MTFKKIEDGSFKVSYHPSKFDEQRHCSIEGIMVLVCHVISQDLGIKDSCVYITTTPQDKLSSCQVLES